MNSKKNNNEGMTLPELILAVLMLTAFTGVTVMVTQYTSRFFRPVNEESDLVKDFSKINNIFDSIIEIISEPGISKNDIEDFDCTSKPSEVWGIPSINDESIPGAYKICIDSTELVESDDYSEMLGERKGKPGIYILYSKIKTEQSISTMPIRRIFCRPKPFCIKKD